MKSLLSLYQVILVQILSEWIVERDLCCLDTAICSRTLREGFLRLLKHVVVINDCSDEQEQLDWIDLRELTISSIILEKESLDNSQIVKQLSRIRHLRVLQITSIGVLNRLLSDRIRIDSLLLSSISTFCDFPERLDCIISLDVSKLYEVTTLDQWITSCRNLLVLIVNDRMDVTLALQHPIIQRIEGVSLERIFHRDNWCAAIGTLMRTSELDKSTIAVCGNYFHLINLRSDYCDAIIDLIIPLIVNVKTLHVGNNVEPLLRPLAITTANNPLLSLTVQFLSLDEDLIIGVLEQSPLLTDLHFCRCRNITSRTMATLAHSCRRLEKLTIEVKTADERYMVNVFNQCPSLREVRFGLTLPTDTLVRLLAVNLSSLKLCNDWKGINKSEDGCHLSVEGRQVTGYFNLPRLLARNPHLNKVHIVGIRHFTDYKMKQLVDGCPLLSTFIYSSGFGVTDQVTITGLSHLVRCRNLTNLTLHYKEVTDEFVLDLVIDKPYFLKLDLSACRGYSGDVLSSVAKYCSLMRHVRFSSASIQSCHIIELLQGCPVLDVLVLIDCPSVDAEILPFLRSGMKAVDLSGTAITRKELHEQYLKTGFTSRSLPRRCYLV